MLRTKNSGSGCSVSFFRASTSPRSCFSRVGGCEALKAAGHAHNHCMRSLNQPGRSAHGCKCTLQEFCKANKGLCFKQLGRKTTQTKPGNAYGYVVVSTCCCICKPYLDPGTCWITQVLRRVCRLEKRVHTRLKGRSDGCALLSHRPPKSYLER